MCGFHMLMMFLGVIGSHFKDAGLQDIFILSEVLADGSAERAMTDSSLPQTIPCWTGFNIILRIYQCPKV